jgi:hypothetical protein
MISHGNLANIWRFIYYYYYYYYYYYVFSEFQNLNHLDSELRLMHCSIAMAANNYTRLLLIPCTLFDLSINNIVHSSD